MKRFYSVAPMMGRTDSQFRYLIRLISEKTVLFTEMIHSNAILYGNKNKQNERIYEDDFIRLLPDFEMRIELKKSETLTFNYRMQNQSNWVSMV